MAKIEVMITTAIITIALLYVLSPEKKTDKPKKRIVKQPFKLK